MGSEFQTTSRSGDDFKDIDPQVLLSIGARAVAHTCLRERVCVRLRVCWCLFRVQYV
jgi:hypothetical protein